MLAILDAPILCMYCHEIYGTQLPVRCYWPLELCWPNPSSITLLPCYDTIYSNVCILKVTEETELE